MNGGQISTSGNQHSKKSIERITQIQKLPPSSPLQTPPPLLSIKAAGLERESAIANRQSSLFPTARNIIPNLSRYLFAATKATTASTAQQSTKIGVVKVTVATGNNNKDKNTEQQTLTIVPKSYSNANDTGAENVPNQTSMTNNNATTTKSKVREKEETDEEEFEDDEEKEQDEEEEEEEEEGEGDEKQKDVPHVYGIPLNPIKLDGVCAACYGEEKFPDDEPILLCDGAGCTREYHLKCITPAMTKIPKGDFFCQDCCPHGSSFHLKKYFNCCEEVRSEFVSSRAFVEALLGLHTRRSDRQNEKTTTGGDEEKEASSIQKDGSGGGVEHDGSSGGSATVEKSKTPSPSKKRKRESVESVETMFGVKLDTKSSMSERGRTLLEKIIPTATETEPLENKEYPRSEIGRITDLHYAALDDSRWRSEDQSCSSSDTLKREVTSNITATANSKKNRELGPEFLVGKTLRMYCPIDNVYHSGRIINWRIPSHITNSSTSTTKKRPTLPSNTKNLFYETNTISRTEYLVRFPAGIDGRKKTVRQWMILEEHSCAVSTTIIIGQKDKGRGINGWRPAQTLLRTSLELLPLQHLLITEGHWGLASFFGDGSHKYLNLETEAVNLFSRDFDRQRTIRVHSSAVRNQEGYNHFMTHSMLVAEAEVEEQRRTFRWHTLPLQNAAHRKALTLVDEFALEPLVEEGMLGSGGLGSCGAIPAAVAAGDEGVGDRGVLTMPKLCPLIQKGVDRQWLARQFDCGEIEHSLDTMASFSCKDAKSISLKIAQLHKRR